MTDDTVYSITLLCGLILKKKSALDMYYIYGTVAKKVLFLSGFIM